MGLNSYRFSIEWAKIEPREGEWNEEALEWYSHLLDRCEFHGLLPMATLHHFTLPEWLASKGGFSHRGSIAYFSRFAEKIADRFAGRIPLWITFNEPMVLLLGAYIGKFMPPARFSPTDFALASANILEAHIAAYKILHAPRPRTGPWAEHAIEVGIAHNMLDFIPDRWWHPLERLLTPLIRRFYNRSWLDALTGRRQHFGFPFLVPNPPSVKAARGICWLDFIGVNYYTKAYVRWRPKDSSAESIAQLPVGVAFARRREPQSDLGWAFHPEGFSRVMREAARYGLPIYITENGLADKEDYLREKYLVAHLTEIAKARESNLDVRGYFHWSLLDNFEWIKGYGPRFGLIAVDYQTQERTPRQSALVYERIIRAHESNEAPLRSILELH